MTSSTRRSRSRGLASSVALLALVSAAAAQTNAPGAPAAPAAPAVSADPQQTTATFGDWVLRCTRLGADAASPRACEVMQTLQREGQGGIVAQIAIGRRAAGEPLRLTVLLPVNIAIPGSVRMVVGERDTSVTDLAWRRCVPQGCLADAEAKDEVLRRWRAETGAGRLTFRDAANRDVAIRMSFRGLAQALEALART